MKPHEFRRLLEEHIECSMLEREKRAYRIALAMFLMVEIPQEGTKDRADESRHRMESLADHDQEARKDRGHSAKEDKKEALAAGEGNSAKVKSKTDTAQAAGEGNTAEGESKIVATPAAGEGNTTKSKSKIGTTPAAGEGNTAEGESKIDTTPAAGEGNTTKSKSKIGTTQAAGGKKRVYNFKMKECIKCGDKFRPSYGPQTMCRNCAARMADDKIKQPVSNKDAQNEAEKIAEKLVKRM